MTNKEKYKINIQMVTVIGVTENQVLISGNSTIRDRCHIGKKAIGGCDHSKC